MNLENFPISPTAKKMLKMVSNGFYDDSYVGKWIYQVMGAELDSIGEKVGELPEQAFVDRATWGLAFWEDLVGIAIREDLSNEERRILIKNKLRDNHPISPAWLKQYLESLTGRTVEIIEYPGSYIFNVTVKSGDGDFEVPIILDALQEVKPAHLGVHITIQNDFKAPLFFGSILVERVEETIGCDSVPGMAFYLGDDTRDEVIGDDSGRYLYGWVTI